MHIPDSMLHGAVCPVTAGLSLAGVAVAACLCQRARQKPTASGFGAVTALVFAGQMLNFPILNGSSGHLVGGVMAAAMLGVPFGVLSLSLVVAIQSLVFSDGGVSTLGANVLNMAIIGAGMGGFIYARLEKKMQAFGSLAALAVASWASIVLASLAASVELASDGKIAFLTVAPAMVGVHGLIGIGEALITMACVSMMPAMKAGPSDRNAVAIPMLTAFLAALLLSPFASGYPDGLEWIAAKYSFLHAAAPTFAAPLQDYAFPLVSNATLSTGLAGLAGALIAFSAAWLVMRALRLKPTLQA